MQLAIDAGSFAGSGVALVLIVVVRQPITSGLDLRECPTKQPNGNKSKAQGSRRRVFCYHHKFGGDVAAEKYKVGLVQMSCTPDPERNLAHAIDMVRDAAGQGAQVVCLPELFQTQYFCQREDAALFDLAEPIPGATTTQLSQVARQQGITLIASLFEKQIGRAHV